MSSILYSIKRIPFRISYHNITDIKNNIYIFLYENELINSSNAMLNNTLRFLEHIVSSIPFQFILADHWFLLASFLINHTSSLFYDHTIIDNDIRQSACQPLWLLLHMLEMHSTIYTLTKYAYLWYRLYIAWWSNDKSWYLPRLLNQYLLVITLKYIYHQEEHMRREASH